jgi:AraC-like DNA-binding protein
MLFATVTPMSEKIFHKSAQIPIVPHRGVLRPRDFSDDFQFSHYDPPATLRRHVAYMWVISWNFEPGITHESLAVLPDPQVNVYFSKDGVGVQPIFEANHIYQASGQGCVAGITFKPGGFYGFWRHDISRMATETIDIRYIFPEVDERYAANLLRLAPDAIAQKLRILLLSKSLEDDANITLVQQIITAIERNQTLTTVDAVARHFHKSDRALQQLFHRYVGVGVKWVLLRNRVLNAIESSQEESASNWSFVAMNLGYSSQAHFITDFKRTVGMTPTEYRRYIT